MGPDVGEPSRRGVAGQDDDECPEGAFSERGPELCVRARGFAGSAQFALAGISLLGHPNEICLALEIAREGQVAR
jgi:hypothetical protein